MSAHRILLVENPAELSIVDGRLCLRRENMDDAFVPPDDIAVLVLHHPVIRLSVHVLCALAQAGGMLLVTDERHYPAGMLWPWTGQSVFTRRLRQQIALDAGDKKAVLWGELVRGRIATQALNFSTSALPFCVQWWRGKSPPPALTRLWVWATIIWKIRLILRTI